MAANDLSQLNIPELLKLKSEYETLSAQFEAKQMALKIMINSAYGAVGCSYFRYYKVSEATAITISGQAAITWVAKKVNEYLNKIIGTKDIDFVVMSDTDSIYVDMSGVVDKFFPGLPEEETIDKMTKVADIKIQEVIEKAYAEFADMTNIFENHLDMKREAIGNAVVIKKKKYVMRVFDSEGVRYSTPEIKIIGHESVRTQTPEFCRNEMKKVLSMIFTSDEKSVIAYIDDIKKRFMQLHISDIGSPTGVKNMAKFDLGDSFESGTPFHVKASLHYNRLIKRLGIDAKYRPIMDGEKVKIISLMMPNPIMAPEIAFPSSLPEEFELDKYIDKEAQFQKYFVEPMKRVLDIVGWKHDNRVTLDDFF